MDDVVTELEVIKSIFDSSVDIDFKAKKLTYFYEENSNIYLHVKIPDNYPNDMVECVLGFKEENILISNIKINEVNTCMKNFIDSHTGENILFDLINTFKMLVSTSIDIINKHNEVKNKEIYIENKYEHKNELNEYKAIPKITQFFDHTKTFNKQNISNIIENNNITIVHGEKITIKKSTFQAHYAFIQNSHDISIFKQQLYNDKRIANATHNILVYKLRCNNGRIDSDFDDDGETGAGRKLLSIVNRISALNNVVIVVTRWFGGILLGPSRFRIICDVAITTLRNNKLIP